MAQIVGEKHYLEMKLIIIEIKQLSQVEYYYLKIAKKLENYSKKLILML
jgi:hypothetical protein